MRETKLYKFIVDNNVGRLSTWLRALGYDTLFINPIDDGELVRIAGEEKRIILTKDTGILQRAVVVSGQVQAIFVEGSHFLDQLAHVSRTLHLTAGAAFTRCLDCNLPVVTVQADEAKGAVPADVLARQRELLHCPGCGKFYWQGGHWERMRATLEQALKNAENA